MSIERIEYISQLYSFLANELTISDSMFEKAARSYQAVARWLDEQEPDFEIKIFPQGSISLGTTNKPSSDKDEYDIDLVCLLKNGQHLGASEIKGIVGDRLKEHELYAKMLDKEGKRCWTLNYDEYHMDILPAVPQKGIYLDKQSTEIRITNKEAEGVYTDKYSNPAAYKDWFYKQMELSYVRERFAYAERTQNEIDKIPEFKVRTPLQKSIQLLKRHRDIMFEKSNVDDAPISIIITTLAALSYDNENDIYTALDNILLNMKNYVYKDDVGKYYVYNPVMHEENFAEKWNGNNNKAKMFFRWLDKAREDLVIRPMQAYNNEELSKILKESLGENMTNRAYNKMANEMRQLREEGKAYVNGTKGGVTVFPGLDSQKIVGHTFYGT